MKTGPDTLGTAKNEFGRKKKKPGPDAIGTVEKESGSTKLENRT
jgi:hypothetical protein